MADLGENCPTAAPERQPRRTDLVKLSRTHFPYTPNPKCDKTSTLYEEPYQTLSPQVPPQKPHPRTTLSNNYTLMYHIGCDDKNDSNQTIYFRINANTGGGFFNDEWIALADIQAEFEKWPVDNPLTSFALNYLFKGRSVNSRAFLMATLKGKHRSYEYQGGDEFVDAMNKMVVDGVYLKAEVTTKVKPDKPNTSVTKKPNRSSKPQLKSASSKFIRTLQAICNTLSNLVSGT